MTLKSRRSRKMSLRKRKTFDALSHKCQDKDESITDSSLNDNYFDLEDEEMINTARENLQMIKKDVDRNCRLTKLKLGLECTSLPFSKAALAKFIFHNTQKGGNEKLINGSSSHSTISFNNVASSTGNSMLTRKHDKNLSQETRNNNFETFNPQDSKCNSTKEVTFQENTFELSRSKIVNFTHLDSHSSKDIFMGEKLREEFSSNFTFKGPTLSKTGRGRAVAIVTPGPEANNPLSVLRRPTAGELAVSLFGSPLLVAPDCAPTSMPQINLPTADGKVVSILPREGFTVEDMPHLATPTRYQLKTLNKYLNDLCHQQENL